MAFSFHGSCRECGHEWDGLGRVFECGQVELSRPEAHGSYVCPRCFVQLHVPHEMSRASYLRWVYENASELYRSPLMFHASEHGVRVSEESIAVIARSPLLFKACKRVARILAGARSRYVPVPIDIGSMTCPSCCERMIFGDIDSATLICPHCESRSARSLGRGGPETILVDYRPLDDGLVHGVILYLERLAGHSKGSNSKRPITDRRTPGAGEASVKVAGPLWDLELDGGSEPARGCEGELDVIASV